MKGRCFKTRNNKKRAFTLIELLVVVAIIGILSSAALISLSSLRESAKISVTIAQVRELEKALDIYFADTGVYPSDCHPESSPTCSATNDPLLVNTEGLSSWRGPYIAAWSLTHGWGGHIGFTTIGTSGLPDWDNDGVNDFGILLNDDRPATDQTDNQGKIPASAMLEIDRRLDDGDLTTGNVRGNGGGWPNNFVVAGELRIKLVLSQ